MTLRDAQTLSQALDTTAGFWTNLQAQHNGALRVPASLLDVMRRVPDTSSVDVDFERWVGRTSHRPRPSASVRDQYSSTKLTESRKVRRKT